MDRRWQGAPPTRIRCNTREEAQRRQRRFSAADCWRYFGEGTLALTEPDSTPRATRALLLAFAVVGAWLFALCRRVLRRGSVDLARDQRRIAATALVCTPVQTLWFAWRTLEDRAQAAGLAVAGVLFVAALALFARQRRNESAARQRERELRAHLAARA